MGRAVVARRGHLRRRCTAASAAFGIRLFVGARRRGDRRARLPPRAAPGARPDGRAAGITARRARGHLHALVGAAAPDRRAVPRWCCSGSSRCPTAFVGRHPLVVLPVLFWLWANIHGTFALGFAYLGLHLLGRWLDGAPPWDGRERLLLGRRGDRLRRRRSSNPYGARRCVTFPVDLLSRGDILSHVIEWQSPDFRERWGIALGSGSSCSWSRWRAARHRVTPPRPRRHRADAAPRALGAAQRRGRAAHRAPGRRAGVRRATTRRSAPLRSARPVVAVAVRGDRARDRRRSRRRDGRSATSRLDATRSSAMRYLERNDLLGRAAPHRRRRRRLRDPRALARAARLHRRPLRHVPDVGDRRLLHASPAVRRAGPRCSTATTSRSSSGPRTRPLAALLDESADWDRVHRDATDAVWVRARHLVAPRDAVRSTDDAQRESWAPMAHGPRRSDVWSRQPSVVRARCSPCGPASLNLASHARPA